MKKFAVALASLLVGVSVYASPPAAFAAPYTVKAGDTLWTVATANGMSVKELMTLNGLTQTMLYPGQTLQLPDIAGYSVRPGETLNTIAIKLGIPLNVFIHANPQLQNPNVIWPGMKLTIPTKPAKFVNGTFPLKNGTYQPYIDDYADARTWTPDGTAARVHEGNDIFANEGTPVYAAAGGTILNVGWNNYGGWRITVKTDKDTAFYYAHLSRYSQTFKIGGSITQGQLLGFVGNTGYGPEGTKGKFLPHLHFGIYNTAASPWTTVSPYTYLKWWELNR